MLKDSSSLTLTTVWDSIVVIQDGGDYDCNIDSTFCVQHEISVTKHMLSQTAKG